MNISEVATLSGLSVKTVRYYDEIGLVTANREDNGYRSYDDSMLKTLRFLQRSRSLGFSIEECRSLVSLYKDKKRASADVKRLAQARIGDIEKKIKELESLKQNLESLTNACHGDDSPECPIIDDLAGP
ncbi:UNVERIFIED_CONTAM: hypothetical protein GTU68_054156 [Idotea baltica]|nr:hypothetical protein [Idotea baltica]